MAAQKFLVLAIFVVAVQYCVALDFDNLLSTAKIVAKSCYYPGVKTEETAQKFMACYDADGVAGKEHFIKCQMEVFGQLFDSVEHVKENCKTLTTLPKYANCLNREFTASEDDMDVSVRNLNACQLPLLTRDQ